MNYKENEEDIYIDLDVEGRTKREKITCLVDTGFQGELILPYNTLVSLGLIGCTYDDVTMKGIGADTKGCYYQVYLHDSIIPENDTISIEAYTIPDSDDMENIVGMGILSKLKACIDLDIKELKRRKNHCPRDHQNISVCNHKEIIKEN